MGDSCEEVFLKFSKYVDSNGTKQAQLGRSVTSRSLFHTENVAESQVVFLYDVDLFDDLQIQVRCDPETDRVVERLVVLD